MFFAVIATTATLAAVFVPLSFLPGQTGGLFREFGFVLAIVGAALRVRGAVALPDAGLAHADAQHAIAARRTGGIGGRIGGALAGLYRRCCTPASTRR